MLNAQLVPPPLALVLTHEPHLLVAQDHVNCLFRLRHCEVEEVVLLDRIGGQTALAKFLLEADRPAAVEPERAWAALTELAERVLAAMAVTP